MHIDTAALAAAITRACAELDRLDAAAAEGPIGRLDGRLLLRIEPDRAPGRPRDPVAARRRGHRQRRHP
jgi:hypothetical protein